MLENDKTIFSYFNPSSNDRMAKYNRYDLFDILLCLNKYYLEYRDNLGFDLNDTFGIEIEFEHFDGFEKCAFYEFYQELIKVANKEWNSKNDISLVQGREITSEVLIDNFNCWDNIKRVCEFSSCHGRIDQNCSAHVHVGSQILGENVLYWNRFFRLWSVYENIIYRFCYGEYLTNRPNILRYSRPAASFFEERLKLLDKDMDYSLLQMLRILDGNAGRDVHTKNMGVSFWRMLADDNYNIYEDFDHFHKGCTLELRAANGTLDEIIWQNYINFFMKMLYYCKSDKFDEDILARRKIIVKDNFSNLSTYSDIYLEQALEFVDMVFNNNLDKIYFLRQYLKSMGIDDKPFVKARKMTVTNR